MESIERAILSCHDKSGLVEFGQTLQQLDVELVSTEGTHRALEEAGIASKKIGDFTGVREMLNGRVKTLHPSIHAGLLGLRDNKIHNEELQTYNYQWIDMVVVNLQPVDDLVNKEGLVPEELMEQVDIGGVAMIRSAAKNFRYVSVVVNPERYTALSHELLERDGELSFQTRFRLAQEAFQVTAAYDRVLSDFLARCEPPQE